MSFTTTGATAPKLVVGGTTVSTAASGSGIAVTVGNATLAVVLSDGSTALDSSKSISGACAVGTLFDGSVCKRPFYNYSRFNLVVFADQNAYIGKIDDAAGTVTPLINQSAFTGNGGLPLALCGIYDLLLPDGRPLVTCVTPAVGNTRRNFPVNPLTGAVMGEYTGVVPAGAVARDVSDSTRSAPASYVAMNVAFFGMYIDVPGVGTYFFTGESGGSTKLRKTTDGFKTNTIIHVGDHKYLATFSNP